MKRSLPVLALLVPVLAGGAWYLSQPRDVAGLIPAAVAQSEDTGTTAVDPASMLLPDHVLGNQDAPITFIEYASYTCPHCANFHEDQFKQLKAEYIDTGKVKFIHREVYFDKYGLWGGLLANCGDEMRYYGLSGMLYAQQKDWIGSGQEAEILENLRTLGKTAGLTAEQIDVCLADQDMATKLVATYQTHSEADGINATPTLVIDGEKHSNMAYADLKAILDAKLGE